MLFRHRKACRYLQIPVVQQYARHLKVDGWCPVHQKEDRDFTDELVLLVSGGRGGSGCSSTYRPPSAPNKVRADGGHGGKGGNVMIQADARTLKLPKRTKTIHAGRGGQGNSHMTQGAVGKDEIVKVPVGTSVWLLDKVFARVPEIKLQYKEEQDRLLGKDQLPAIDTAVSSDYKELHQRFAPVREMQLKLGLRGAVTLHALAKSQRPHQMTEARQWRRDQKAAAVLVAQLQHDGDSVVVAKGARGGLGNAAQVAGRPGNDHPGVWSQAGGLPEQACIMLDCRLQADVALVGLPNAGKSSLLRALTAASPKVAPYAFTTTQPQLGALQGSVRGHWVSIADLPGLLQGAHRDRGLGLDFLKHIQKCRALAFVLELRPQEATSRAPVGGAVQSTTAAQAAAQQLQVLLAELHAYDMQLLQKPSLVVLNKSDCASDPDRVLADFVSQTIVGDAFAALNSETPVVLTSATEGHGLEALQRQLDSMCLEGLHAGVQKSILQSHTM